MIFVGVCNQLDHRCGPCKMVAPHLEEMSKTMDDVVFLKVDVDDCEDIAAEYKVVFLNL